MLIPTSFSTADDSRTDSLPPLPDPVTALSRALTASTAEGGGPGMGTAWG